MHNSKILIVDDQQANLALLRSQLKEYQVIEADSGRLALKRIVEETPDLILLDVMMPGVDGNSVLSIIKNTEETRFIPVVIITAQSSKDVKIKFLENGADDFITKPFDPLELRARVGNLLRIKKLQAELYNIHSVVISLALALESKDTYSANHSKRTAFLAEKFAPKVVRIKTFGEQIRIAGLLHDIGKIGIKDSILLKPAKLDPEEYEIIKTHPVVSERICSNISGLKPVLPVIRHHHEHFDGSGYPDGLKGKEIPLGARVLAIADAFDALTSDRPYRAAHSLDEALRIMAEGAGKQWDPRLLEQFCEMAKNDKTILTEQDFKHLQELTASLIMTS